MHLLVLECSGLNAGNYQMIRKCAVIFLIAVRKLKSFRFTLPDLK